MAQNHQAADIPVEFYSRDAYTSYATLFSLTEQIRWVAKNKIKQVLYIGVGSGFVPMYLRAHNVEVLTLDLNPALKPDILCDVTSMDMALSGRLFQAAMACEVFEHMPFEKLTDGLRQLSKCAVDRVLVTLPVYQRFPIKVCGALKVGRGEVPFGLWASIPKRALPAEHCWEIGSSPETSLSKVRALMQTVFKKVRDARMKINPYHHVFDLRT